MFMQRSSTHSSAAVIPPSFNMRKKPMPQMIQFVGTSNSKGMATITTTRNFLFL